MELNEAFRRNDSDGRGCSIYYTSDRALKGDNTHIKIHVYYSLGGMNYFSGKRDPRGISTSVSVVKREASCESTILGEGYRDFIAEMKRFNAKKLEETIEAGIKRGLEILEAKQSSYFAPAHRPLYAIAHEIRTLWKKVYFGAVPYLDALGALTTPDDSYIHDDGRSIIRYFLSNATTWRGEDARRIKEELKSLL